MDTNILDIVCSDCPYYEPDWNIQVDLLPLPCKREPICKRAAQITKDNAQLFDKT